MKSPSKQRFIVLTAVALRGRAWIEIHGHFARSPVFAVALRGRAWIEIPPLTIMTLNYMRRPPREGVD